MPANWGKSGFDHDKTGFRLEFSHRRASCAGCHAGNAYQGAPKQCVGCHAISDVHANRFGDRCQQCHRADNWSRSTFDHDRDTGYPLSGGHRRRSCNACHAPGYAASKTGDGVRACYSCHRDDDVHQGANGKQCRECHQTGGWHLTEFDHGGKTGFALRGGHARLACAACHVAGAEMRTRQTACRDCHDRDDVHRQALGEDCARCHNDGGWRDGIRFDHDLGAFPLLGQHAALGCEACHASAVFTDAKTECVDCHRHDDPHRGGLGANCARCHNANAWLIWRFEHDDTAFKLEPAHAGLRCESCHDRPLDGFAGAGRRCIGCHRRDDVHDGKFGAQCDRCHDGNTFGTANIRSMQTFESRTRPGAATPP